MPLVKQIKRFVPTLDYNLKKGECGRIGVVGGSLEYTGAPYFAAIAALKTVLWQ
jgi:ATP-dependent NAD(P)H-hydrate dehydratase